ncbi:MAG: PAS domain S-box protein [Methanomicrobiales archaeon]|nr:PAS domain S-box protein [Methanomicrobiales archaeon]MDD1669136.1 PAS domain S-box protein [Methanomicrobiales archaeon]
MTGEEKKSGKIVQLSGEPTEIRVLIVLSDPDLIEYARNDLQSEGCFRVETARSGEEALERLKVSGVDAIVSGLHLPGMGGNALLQTARCGGNTTPFIILSRRPDQQTVIDIFNKGASALIDTETEGGLMPGNLCMAVLRAVEDHRSMLAVRKERDQFRIILSAQRTGLALINPDLSLAWANEETRRLFPGREPAGTLCHLFYEGLDHPCEPCPTLRTFETGTVQESERLNLQDGRWYHMVTQPVWNKDGRVIQVLEGITDITDRKRVEEDLRLSREKYRDLVENANSIIFRSDKEGNITFFNEFAQRFFGFSAPEILGKNVVGTIVPASDSAGRDLAAMIHEIREHPDGYRNNDNENIKKSGERVWISWTNRAIYNDKGEFVELLSVGNDITDRKRAEEALFTANRKLNLLSNVTRHDVLNQLNVLAGYLGLVRDRVSDVDTAALLSRAWDSAWTIRKLIAFTKDYQEIGVHSPRWHDIANTVARASSTLDLDRIALEVEVRYLQVYADPLLEKVFYALMENALRHGERIDRVRVSCRSEGRDQVIVLEDNGVGIPGDEKEKIFARGTGRNTGYGLFIAREILSITGLTITETGTFGQGARFEIRVPEGAYRFGDS